MAFDKGKDGQITYEELKQGLVQFNPSNLAEREIKESPRPLKRFGRFF